MLDSEVDALLNVAVLDTFVDDNTDGALRNIVYNPSFTVVHFFFGFN